MNSEKELTDKLLPILTGRIENKTAIENSLKEVCLYSSWAYGEAWKFDRENNFMRFLTAWYKDANFQNYEKFSALCKFSPGVGLVGKTLESREPVWIEDLQKDFNFLRNDAAKMTGFISGLAIPLFNDSELFGMFAFFLTKKQHTDELNKRIVSNALAGLSFVY